MTKRIALLFGIPALVAFMASDVSAFSRRAPAPVPSVTPSAAPSSAPTPAVSPLPGLPGHVTLAPVDYYTTPAEREKIAAVQGKLNAVVQSQCFHDFMAHRALIQTNGLTAPQVADRLQSLGGIVPVVMYYRRFTSAVAYRNVGDDTININRRFFSVDTPTCQWAATVGHESLGHSLGGYDHDFNWSLSRSFSVPYSIGGADHSQGGSAFDACCVE